MTEMQSTYRIKIIPDDSGRSPAGKLADAELHFSGGPLDGLKLIGFAIWQRRSGAGMNVTMPARVYTVNGERRSFALLRYVSAAQYGTPAVADAILTAYHEHERGAVAPITEAAARASSASTVSGGTLDAL